MKLMIFLHIHLFKSMIDTLIQASIQQGIFDIVLVENLEEHALEVETSPYLVANEFVTNII